MEFINVNNWLRGLLANKRDNYRVPDEFATELHNMDLTSTGKLIRRRGYEYWRDLINNESIPPIGSSFPDTENKTGFGNKIQSVFQYIDVLGNKNIFVVADGRVYIEAIKDNDVKQWTCLNPNTRLVNRVERIDDAAYLDLLFFNDKGNDVMLYDSKSYKDSGWIKLKNRYMYFAGEKIYFRAYSTLNELASEELEINSSAGYEAKTIYDSLKTGISYPYADDLYLGFAMKLKVGEDSFYYVLDNGKNQRGTGNKCQIIMFNDKLIAQKYAEFDMDADGIIINFAYNRVTPGEAEGEGHLYIWCKSGKIYKLHETDFSIEEMDSADIAGLTAPIISGKNYYSIAANTRGLFMYSNTLASRSDWYQPLIVQENPNVPYGQAYINVPFPDNSVLGYNLNAPGYGLNHPGEITFRNLYEGYDVPIGNNIFDSNTKITIQPQALYGWDNINFNLNSVCTSSSDTFWNKQFQYIHITSARLGLSYMSGYNPSKLNVFQLRYQVKDGAGYFFGPTAFLAGYWYFGGYLANPAYAHDSAIPVFSMPVLFNNHETYGEHVVLDSQGSSVRRVSLLSSAVFADTSFKLYYNPLFQFDKNNLIPTEEQATTIVSTSGSESITARTNAYYLIGSYFNPQTFNSITSSKYTLLVGVGYDEQYLYDNITTIEGSATRWRYILPVAKTTDLSALMPITLINNELYFGVDTVVSTSPAGNYYGKYYTFNLSTKIFTYVGSHPSTIRRYIPDDNRWLLKDNLTSNQYKLSNDWKIENGRLPHADYTDMESYLSCLNFYSKKEIVDVAGDNRTDRIVPIGTPKEPQGSITPDNASTLVVEKTYKYFMVFAFTTGKTTGLSVASEQFFIPDYGTDNVRIHLTDLNLLDESSTPIFETADIDNILVYRSELDVGGDSWSQPNLIASFDKIGDLWFYSVREVITAVNTGSKTFTVTGDVSNKYLPGMKIEVIGSTSNDGIYTVISATYGVGTTAIVVSESIPTGTVDGKTSFENSTFDDYNGSPSTVPFIPANVLKHPVNDILIHKNRLIFINKLDEDNSSIIQYSDVGLARSVSPTAIRSIEAGDGDYLVAGESNGDYLYLIKSRGIYAILGDAPDGQQVDIDKKIGTKYRDMVISFEGRVYFLNDFGIYTISGNRVENLMQDRIRDYFDKLSDERIDFNFLEDGWVDVDVESREIIWHVPMIRNGISFGKNNFAIVYNIDQGNFKTREYYHNFSNGAYVRNIGTNEYEYLFADYSGNIFQISLKKNDDFKPIKWSFKTKHFNVNSNIASKIFKLIQVSGKYLNNLRLTYWIDEERYSGDISFRDKVSEYNTALSKVWSRGRAKRIAIEVSGETTNDPPVEIDEILLGFDKAGGFR